MTDRHKPRIAPKPPAAGTGERSSDSALPPAGRVDLERATWGEWRKRAGNVPDGAPPENVGGTQGSQPDDAVADQPEPDVAERPGYREPRTGERRP